MVVCSTFVVWGPSARLHQVREVIEGVDGFDFEGALASSREELEEMAPMIANGYVYGDMLSFLNDFLIRGEVGPSAVNDDSTLYGEVLEDTASEGRQVYGVITVRDPEGVFAALTDRFPDIRIGHVTRAVAFPRATAGIWTHGARVEHEEFVPEGNDDPERALDAWTAAHNERFDRETEPRHL